MQGGEQVGTTSLGSSVSGPTSFRGANVLSSPRFQELNRREAYYAAKQHDGKEYDFDGRKISMRGAGAMVTQPFLNAQVAHFFVPLAARRPRKPYRLPKVIVNAFTTLVFGNQRFPSIKVEGDSDAQDFATQLVKSASLGTKMIRARNIGGSVGTAGLSWCYDQGKPRVEVHNGKYLYVHEWDDREELIPAWVTEVYLERRSEWDGAKRKFLVNWYWRRHDWTQTEDIHFEQVLYKKDQEPKWRPDAPNSVSHNLGFCPFAWIQNTPNDEIDGEPDYADNYEEFDALDLLGSVLMKGGILNLDPTLVLKMDPDMVGRGLSKGSDQSLAVGEDGGAEYLELAGTSIEAGLKLFNDTRKGVLEACQCVITDPSDPIGADVSSVAQRQKYAPMIARAEIFREQYGKALKQILDQMLEVARVRTGAPIVTYVEEDGVDVPMEQQLFVQLPPKILKVEKPKAPPAAPPAPGEPPAPPEEPKDPEDEQPEFQMVDRNPGSGGELELSWPPYFPPTPSDQQAAAGALTTANGGKAVISQQTSVEQFALVIGVEPDEEWDRVQKDGADDAQKAAAQASPFGGDDGGPGGKVGGEHEPPGGKFPGSKPPFGSGNLPKADDGPPI